MLYPTVLFPAVCCELPAGLRRPLAVLCRPLAIGLLVLVAILCIPHVASAVEPELVGIVAIILEEDVAKQLGLTPQQRSALEKLGNDRGDAGLDLAFRAKNLPPEERAVQLAPFSDESESLGMNLLNEKQQSELRAIIRQRNHADTASMHGPAFMPDSDQPTEPTPDEYPSDGAPPEPGETVDVDKPQAFGSSKLRFNFRYQPWLEVLDWFAQQADMSLVMDAPPSGTFNYADSRDYTPTEAIDLLNSVLLTKGYTLVRRGRMLMVINLEDGIPPNLVPFIPLSELDERGEYELVRVIFPLAKLSAKDAKAEIESLLGPQGSTIILPKSRRIQVTETAGRLRTIRSIFDAVEKPLSSRGELREITLKHRVADEILPVVRQMLGMAEETNVLPDGSLRIAVDLSGRRLIVQGDADQFRQLDNVLELLDVPGPEGSIGIAESPQLEVYSITGADPNSTMAVLQTLLAGDPDARLGLDPRTGNIVALARPSQHATIRETISQMQRDARRIDVIPLLSVDPQTAVLVIRRLFGGDTREGEKPDPTAPTVDADPTTRCLLVRASQSQLEQIRSLLEKLGENPGNEFGNRHRENVRLLPLTGRSAQNAVRQIEQIWPTLRPNRIRVVTPSASGISTFRPSNRETGNAGSLDGETKRDSLDKSIPPMDRLPTPSPPEEPAPTARPDEDPSARVRRRVRAHFASQETGNGGQGVGKDDLFSRDADDGHASNVPTLGDNPSGETTTPATSLPGDPILVAPGPDGVLIASQDLDALDDFENLLTSIAGRETTGGLEFAVYYLRYAKANIIAETISEIFGGSSDTTDGGGGASGDIAGAADGGAGGDLVGSLLGLGEGGGVSLGAVDIVPDIRLNALIVRGKSSDLNTLEQLLHILDQPVSPEDVRIDASPRMIPVYNTTADYVSGIVQQVYQDRMRSGSGQQQRRPSPEELIRALRGASRNKGSANREQEEAAKMSIGVDTRSNSLIVRAPDPLFEEVKQLVARLDTIDSNVHLSTQIISLKATNPSAVKEALTALYGQSVQMTGAKTSGKTPPARSSSGNRSRTSGPSINDIRRRMEFFRRMQQQSGSRDRSPQPSRSGYSRSGRGR